MICISLSEGERHRVLKLKQIAKTQLNKGNKRGGKIPQLQYLVPGARVAAVSCSRGQNNPEGDKIPRGVPGDKIPRGDKINCYTGRACVHCCYIE